MSIEADLLGGSISPLVREEGNVIGQPGGGPLAPVANIPKTIARRARLSAQGVADASGIATVNFGAPPVGFCWMLERLTVHSAGAAAVCTVYVGQIDDAHEVDYTAAGAHDIADENSPIYVPGGQAVIFYFTAVTVGASCTATIQLALQQEA